MKVQLVRGKDIVYDPIQMDDIITKKNPQKKPAGEQKVVAILQGKDISYSHEKDDEIVESTIEDTTMVEEVVIDTDNKNSDELNSQNIDTNEAFDNGQNIDNDENAGSESNDIPFNDASKYTIDNDESTGSGSNDIPFNASKDTNDDHNVSVVDDVDTTDINEDNDTDEENFYAGLTYVDTPTGVRAKGPDGKFVSMRNFGAKRDKKPANRTVVIPAK